MFYSPKLYHAASKGKTWLDECLPCNNKKEIISLLKSNNKDGIITGAFYAGESRSREYVPLLLSNALDERRSTNAKYFGITVYQAKMIALGKIYSKYPANKITPIPDSGIVSFYTRLFNSK
jgi:hypothetical protein